MHAERDWLRDRIVPILEERLRERFHHLETIDLRWGVDSMSVESESDRENTILTVCFREIDRSRPFLVGLLGDRYGSRPPPLQLPTRHSRPESAKVSTEKASRNWRSCTAC
jgi:Domain of unknown function (DUF4062)